ncbi:unnamed protein product [Meloidogyne enterolobii]|uniref:Uncharacterized protein n=1 Tax=Meloidogyne enterolobii TaxID=390850 RepID=A0ACB1AJS4_MELEN
MDFSFLARYLISSLMMNLDVCFKTTFTCIRNPDQSPLRVFIFKFNSFQIVIVFLFLLGMGLVP